MVPLNVSHRFGSPVCQPVRNHCWRCSDEPWVQLLLVDLALGLLLDPIVTHRTGGVDRLGDLLLGDRLQDRLLCMVGPHTGVAVRLELGPHRA